MRITSIIYKQLDRLKMVPEKGLQGVDIYRSCSFLNMKQMAFRTSGHVPEVKAQRCQRVFCQMVSTVVHWL